MSKFFKKIQSFVDPVGSLVNHYGGKRSQSIRDWYGGFYDTSHFWDSDRVRRGISRQWSIKGDPLGNTLNRMFNGQNSAASVSMIDPSVYGHTGSIVGRF